MKKKISLVSFSIFCPFLLAAAAHGAVVTTYEDLGSVQVINSITTYGTTGLDMTNMAVTVKYSDTTEQMVSWDSTGAGTGALGTGWSLTMEDPTVTTYWSSYWIFDVEARGKSVTSIILDGFEHNVIFDNEDIVPPGGIKGTLGSEWGNPLTIDYYNAPPTTYNGQIDVTYKGGIQILGQTLYSDVFQSMQIDFAGGFFTEGDTFAFYQDTDNVTNPVPEPGTLILLGVGLTLLTALKASRKNR